MRVRVGTENVWHFLCEFSLSFSFSFYIEKTMHNASLLFQHFFVSLIQHKLRSVTLIFVLKRDMIQKQGTSEAQQVPVQVFQDLSSKMQLQEELVTLVHRFRPQD